MSQQGYSWLPDGYYQPQPDPANVYSPYAATVPPPIASGAIHTYSPSGPPHPTAENSRNVIPGLGLGQANGAVGWQPNALSHLATPAEARPEPSLEDSAIQSHDPVASRTTEAQSSVMEDGELSEGQLEDIYEPREAGEVLSSEWTPTAQNVETQTIGGVAKTTSLTANAGVSHIPAVERSGSYSPYLSPAEVNLYSAGEHSDSANNQQSLQPQKNPSLSDPQTQATATVLPPGGTLKTRGQAKEAILELSQLSVRFGDYLKEGIDKTVLHNLFQDLGLDENVDPPLATAPEPTMGGVLSNPATMIEAPPVAIEQPQEASVAPICAPATDHEEESKNKQAESRKDRIARLLAAKESKQNATAEARDDSASPASSSPQISALPKVQSAKSKLLQQKMEALQKSRAFAGQTPTEPAEKVPETPSAVQVISAADAVTDTPLNPPSESSDQDNTGTMSSIPGLFLSSTMQPSGSSPAQKRSIASDLDDLATAPPKRPFGQPRSITQRLVIDVSDDDDDAAMDIDSPELIPAPVNQGSSPFKIPAFNDLVAPTGNFTSRRVSSPSTVPTPPIATPPVKGKVDLENMHREIENMKRKIAEAEARKKAKLSLPGSPLATPQLEARPEDRALSSMIADTKLVESGERDLVHQDDSILGAASNTASITLPKRSSVNRELHRGRRSLSRAASEQLPIIQARRKQQELKLQALQSQLRRTEREIQLSLEEEKSLIEDSEILSSHESSPEPSRAIQSTHDTAVADEAPAPALARTNGDIPNAANPETTTMVPEQEMAALGASETTMQAASGFGADNSGHVSPLKEASPLDDSEPSALSLEDEPFEPEGQADVEEDRGHDVSMDEPDNYEPQVEESSSSQETSSEASSFSPAPVADAVSAEASDNDDQVVSTIAPVTQPISSAQRQSQSESPREVTPVEASASTSATRTSFQPYETPMQYFRAYRFHPQFKESIAGGLRSLTYSNKIDVQKELCPDQLSGGVCPRGSQCEFQHFESMQAPDDQILVQLGGYGNYEGEQKQEYVNGLRRLLTDYRAQKIKDFQAISQGIIDYRAKFRGDKTKILPIGNVSI